MTDLQGVVVVIPECRYPGIQGGLKILEEKSKMTNLTFAEKREKLAHLSDRELHKRFWDLTAQIVQPEIEMAQKYTTPAIERSVLLRCGISSTDAAAIVKTATEKGLLGHGAGNLVYRLSQKRGISIKAAGAMLASARGWEDLEG